MEFIETPTFTRLVLELLTDEEYRIFQLSLRANPACGEIIKAGGAYVNCVLLLEIKVKVVECESFITG